MNSNHKMIIEDVGPTTNLEWLWTLDLTELSCGMLRYRRLRERILQAYRAKAIASILQRLDGAGYRRQPKELSKPTANRLPTAVP